MNTKNLKINALIVGSLVLATVIFAPSAKADELRLAIRVNEAFEVNGQLYDAGKLSLRQTGDYNPSATINEIWVGNQCLGILLAQQVESDVISDSDSFLFDRNAKGTLVLVGVTFRGQRARELYQYSVTQDGRWMRPGDQPSPVTGTLLASR